MNSIKLFTILDKSKIKVREYVLIVLKIDWEKYKF